MIKPHSPRPLPVTQGRRRQYGRRIAAVLTALALCDSVAHADSPAFPEASYRKHIEVLSSDAFEGRAPGTEGEKKTLAYLEQQFRAAGLEPGNGDSYLQAVPLVQIQPHTDAVMKVRGPAGQSLELRNPDDLVAWTRRPVPQSTLENAGIVFAGYGIVAPEYGWNDYAGLDVRGKLVLALVNDPGYATQDPQLFTGNAMTYYGRWDYKFAEAVRQGAAGLLVIHETKAAGYPWDVPRNGHDQPQFDLLLAEPAAQRLAVEGWIQEPAAERLLAAAGLDYAALKRAASQRGFKARPLGLEREPRHPQRRAADDHVQRDRQGERARAAGRGVCLHRALGPPRQEGRREAGRGCDLQRRLGQCHGRGCADRTRPRICGDEAGAGTLAAVRRRDRRGVRPARQRVLRRASAGAGVADGRRPEHGQPVRDRQDARPHGDRLRRVRTGG